MMKLACAFVVVLCGVSRADDLSVSAKAPEKLPSVAVTFSPFHLALPMVEMTAEVRLADKVGIAFIGGVGSVREMGVPDRIKVFEGGASARYYVHGTFRTGLEVGAEALYVHAATNAYNIEVKGAGLGLSPFAGYKWTHSSGLTLEGQLGISYITARGSADTGEMNQRSDWGPLLNLQLGYSF
jgi:hypothetical protein